MKMRRRRLCILNRVKIGLMNKKTRRKYVSHCWYACESLWCTARIDDSNGMRYVNIVRRKERVWFRTVWISPVIVRVSRCVVEGNEK